MTTDVITGHCRGCGTATSRTRVTGAMARFMNDLPLVCDTCAADEARREREAEERERQHEAEAAWRRRRTDSGLPKPLQARTLADLDDHGRVNVLAAAARWADGDLLGLLLTGGVGVGKTTIAAAAVVERTRTETVMWVSAHQLVRDLQAPFDSPERQRANDLVSGRIAAAIAVDDLDKVRPSEFAAEAIFGLVDICETGGRGLLITTNLRPAELAQKWPAPYGEAIGSRLRGTCAAFALDGHDRRGTR